MQNGQLRAVTLFIAGLMGLFGVISAAAASHGADPRLLGGASAAFRAVERPARLLFE